MADAELHARLRELEMRLAQLQLEVRNLKIALEQGQSQANLIRAAGNG